MIELALATSIPPAAWVEAGGQAIETALELLAQHKHEHDDGRQFNG